MRAGATAGWEDRVCGPRRAVAGAELGESCAGDAGVAVAAVEANGEEECAICMANIANAKLAPCKHMGVCAACALELMWTTRRCLLCRADVQFFTGVVGGSVVVLAAAPPQAPVAAAMVVVVEVAAALDVDVEEVVAAVEVVVVVVVVVVDDEDAGDDVMLVIDVEICDDVVVVD